LKLVRKLTEEDSLMTEHNANNQQAADILWQAAHSGTTCAPVRDLINQGDIDAAYAIQQINIQRALLEGGRLIGSKIGLTAKTVQKQLGVD
jgi:2-keto-4-pentenoate hydratase